MARGLLARAGRRHGLPDLPGGESPCRQIRIAQTDVDLDDAVPAEALTRPLNGTSSERVEVRVERRRALARVMDQALA